MGIDWNKDIKPHSEWEVTYAHEYDAFPTLKEVKKNKVDNVNHPKHYESSCSVECIDMMWSLFGMEALYHFCILNAFKYIWRHKYKNGAEDLDKAKWYYDKARDIYPESEKISNDYRDRVEELISTLLCVSRMKFFAKEKEETKDEANNKE